MDGRKQTEKKKKTNILDTCYLEKDYREETRQQTFSIHRKNAVESEG